MRSLGHSEWFNIVGIRTDEPIRVARMRAPKKERWENVLPLAEAGVTKHGHVLPYWQASPFDLQLPLDERGETYGGNCDLCYLKSTGARLRVIREQPKRAKWWIERERRTGMVFREHGYTVEKLAERARLPVVPSCDTADDLGDCICHD